MNDGASSWQHPPLFPWFGAKRPVTHLVWQRFGQVQNYVEPFAGSAAMLWHRPGPITGPETINDFDRYVANFWRSVRSSRDEVVDWADGPVSEVDLHARHRWLVTEGRARLEALGMSEDPFAHDPQVAGWWVWGICQWIGSGWCAVGGESKQLPHLGDARRGLSRKLPHLGDARRGLSRKLPHLGNAGRGLSRKLPHLGNAGMGLSRQLPHLGDARRGRCAERRDYIHGLISAYSDRLRDVRVCCGDWSRVTGPSVTTGHGLTAVILDPPYLTEVDGKKSRSKDLYSTDSGTVAHEVREWALEAGKDSLMRICLAGYEGEHEMPGWEKVPWKAQGGFGSQGEGMGRENAGREVLWFSPNCLGGRQGTLF